MRSAADLLGAFALHRVSPRNWAVLLSRRQSECVARAIYVERLGTLDPELPIRVGDWEVRVMGRRFRRNGNGSVLHVLHVPSAEARRAEDDQRILLDVQRILRRGDVA